MNLESVKIVIPWRRARGFTLIETALAIVIIGSGIMGLMELFSACSQGNSASSHLTTALMLAGNVQEITQGLPFDDTAMSYHTFGVETGETLASYDDMDDFDGKTFNPPLDATRTAIPALGDYSQVISVMPVYPNQPSINCNETTPDIPKTSYTGALRVRVRIMYRKDAALPWSEVHRAQWVRVDR